ncbi:MAG: hypothetical protein ACPGXL_06160 [Chitinophagales bacterium]
MGKSNKKANKKAQKTAKQATENKQTRKQSATSKRFWQQYQKPLMAIMGLGIVLYAYSISFDYALDDQIVIMSNQYTKLGFEGIGKLFTTETFEGFFGVKKDLVAGGRYRPLSLVSFAVEWQLFGQNPAVSHFINILLYCLLGCLLYRILMELLPPQNPKGKHWYLTLPFIATALFIAHPLHTEVVANIKGRDEIMTFLGALGALYATLKYLKTKQIHWLGVSGVVFFLGLLSKENAITFLAVIPFTLYFFTQAKPKDYITISLPLIAATVVFLAIRTNILGFLFSSGKTVEELLNNPFVEATGGQKMATILYTLGLYVKLLIFPHPLTHDYYPYQIPLMAWTDWQVIVSALTYAGIVALGIWGLVRKHIIGYGILFYLIPLSIVSNILFPVGTFMNERFVFISSLGFCLILAYLMMEQLPKLVKGMPINKLLTYALLSVLTVYGLRTLVRLPAWENDYALFMTDVKTSTNSAKVLVSAGGTITQEAVKPKNSKKRTQMLTEGIGYLNKALAIYPNSTNALLLRGNAHYELNKNYESMFGDYYHLLTMNPNRVDVLRNLNMMSDALEVNTPEVNQFINFLENKILPLGTTIYYPYDALGVLYGRKKNDLPNAIKYFEKAAEYAPGDIGVNQDLAIAYGMAGRFDEALTTNFKALALAPKNAKILLNISITYQNMNQTEKAAEFLQKAQAIDPNILR